MTQLKRFLYSFTHLSQKHRPVRGKLSSTVYNRDIFFTSLYIQQTIVRVNNSVVYFNEGVLIPTLIPNVVTDKNYHGFSQDVYNLVYRLKSSKTGCWNAFQMWKELLSFWMI